MRWQLVPLVLQGAFILIDEFVFHRRRGLPRWERIGHPLDTLTVMACFAYLIWVPNSPAAWTGYIALALFSTLFITKDEWVHAEECCGAESWLHAVLFILHPIALAAGASLWELDPFLLMAQLAAMTLFFGYQTIYWNWRWRKSTTDSTTT